MVPEAARLHLSNDERLRPLVAAIQPAPSQSKGDLYAELVESIIYQQLSIKAAATIHQRFLDLFPEGYPVPEALVKLDTETLRGVGLSYQKASYVRNVAEFFLAENLIGYKWDEHEDEEILKRLTQIKGVGRWTVEMILMFTLRREDVFPMDDLGVQNSMIKLYGLTETGKALRQRMTEIADAWRPYRSWACVYLWRWKDAAK
ncbi:MAG: DNA-3-methyladenine glycosylase 2 family protein [Saprospiraceae bacterium]|nr:DNA-3-methyladenine glycosylase 2 family protein [Saprospiraceae bacterium]